MMNVVQMTIKNILRSGEFIEELPNGDLILSPYNCNTDRSLSVVIEEALRAVLPPNHYKVTEKDTPNDTGIICVSYFLDGEVNDAVIQWEIH